MSAAASQPICCAAPTVFSTFGAAVTGADCVDEGAGAAGTEAGCDAGAVVGAGEAVDGATLPTIYRKIVIPSMRPVFFSVLLILCHITIKTFDLVVALTAGGPGTSSSLPAMFMYTFSFNRGQLGLGAASSVMMLATVVAVLVPLMYMESRSTRNAA